MAGEPFFLIVLVILALAVLFRVLANGWDRDRIRDHLSQRGGRAVEITWRPFGPGWFGTKNERIYEVRYMDGRGVEHVAHCKTSMLSGVYWTDDNLLGRVHALPPASGTLAAAPGSDELGRLREENERLRAELRRRSGS